MTKLNPAASAYAEKLRLRVCGICIQDNKLLLVRHAHTIDNSCFWAPPGGGLDYGETMEQCLRREFQEETGLEVEVQRFLFINEFMQEPLHAVEMYFEVRIIGGNLQKGTDPEADAHEQMIEQVSFVGLDEINQIPQQDKHRVLHHLFSLDDLLGMSHHFLK